MEGFTNHLIAFTIVRKCANGKHGLSDRLQLIKLEVSTLYDPARGEMFGGTEGLVEGYRRSS